MSEREDWWQTYGHAIPEGYQEFIEFENTATRISICSSVIVPGILQTESYAQCATRQFSPILSQHLIDNRVRVRMDRQWHLFEREPVPEIHILLDETVLLRPVGGAQVLKEQLAHLVQLIKSKRINLQIMPLQNGTIWPMLGYPLFVLLEAPKTSLMSTESISAQDQVNRHGIFETNHFRTTFDNLCEQSLSCGDSLAFIKDTIDRSTTGAVNTWTQVSKNN